MRCAWLFVLLACSSKGEQPGDTSCEQRIERHARWLKMLVAEGGAVFPSSRELRLVTVRDVAPAQLPLQPIVMLEQDAVTFQGRYLGRSGDELDPRSLADAFANLSAQHVEEIALVIDETVPWRTVATVGRAAAIANLARLRFVFRGESTLAKPPRSWMDAVLEPIEKPADPEAPAPSLEPKPRLLGQQQLFDRCPSGRALFDGLDERATSSGRDKGTVLAAELPGALRACGCAEDINAVERWLWSAWNRYDENMPHASVSIELAPQAKSLDIPAREPWLLAHGKVVAHAGQAVAF